LIFCFWSRNFGTLGELFCPKMIKIPRKFYGFNELVFFFLEFFFCFPSRALWFLEYLDLVVFVSWDSIKSVRETTDRVLAP
jgi:hypothetical protein